MDSVLCNELACRPRYCATQRNLLMIKFGGSLIGNDLKLVNRVILPFESYLKILQVVVQLCIETCTVFYSCFWSIG